MKYFRAFIGLPIYSATDTPAMPLPIGHAHFGGFFYAWRSGLNMMIEELNEALSA
jgi:hypothetical protein